MIELTEKILAEAGGWQAMKEARAMHAAGRVLEAEYVEGVLRGLVRGGETQLRSGLNVIGKTNMENLCTCLDSKKRGLICAHSLAVGLQVIKGAPVGPESAKLSANEPMPMKLDHPFSTEEGTPCELHVILPPNFPGAWAKKTVMVVTEAAMGDQPKPLGALTPGVTYLCSEQDRMLAEKLAMLAGGKLPAMAMLSCGQFLELLGVLGGHPRVTFGKSEKVEVSGPEETVLKVDRKEDGSLLCSAGVSPAASSARDQTILLGSASAWCLTGPHFAPLAPGLPAPYLVLFEKPLQISSEAAAVFLQRELPLLAGFFRVEGTDVAEAMTAEPREAPKPEFHLKLEGSLNFLDGTLEADYGGRRVTLDAGRARLAKFARNRAAEEEAIGLLNRHGFIGPDENGLVRLKGEAAILSFFAAGLPRLQKRWTVSVGERFSHVTREVERIAPKIEIRSSGEQWFDLSYELATPSGERFSGSDIQRLLQAGQNHLKRKDGKVVVFEMELLNEFQELMRDSNPKQMQPGLYRMDRSQAGVLSAFTEEMGVNVGGDARWREWAGGERKLEQMVPVELGSLKGVLRPYQEQGVNWLHFLAQNSFGGILADEMGLGKTLQVLAFLRTLKGKGPALVVCPSSLTFNWRNEAAKWTPEARVLTVEGAGRAGDFTKIPGADLVITSYPLLRRDIESYRQHDFSAVFLDEAQHIKNPDSQNAQVASLLRTKHRFVMTGTPVENSVRDLWSLMNFLMPGYLGNRNDFKERYEQPIHKGEGDAEQSRLNRRIRPFLLRRCKKDVIHELPDKLEQVTYCELSTTQKEIYNKLATATREQLSALAGAKDQNKSRMLMLTALLRLRQAACDCRLLGLEEGVVTKNPSSKLDLLEELIGEAIDGGHRVLVFSQFVTMLGFMKERLDASETAYCYLDGQTRNREGQVARFQSGEVPVFLISLKAGGTGLNLTAADTVIHFDPWWNPAVEAQATDRAHRIGQKKVVTSYKLIARDTVEEKILNLQQKKRAVIAATLESEQPLMEGLTMAEIEQMLL